jgi:hypothetical protein
VVFGGIAAIGAGFEVAVDVATHHSELSGLTAALSVAVLLAAVLVVMSLLQRRIGLGIRYQQPLVLLGAVLVLAAGAAAAVWDLGLCVLLMGALLAALVAGGLVMSARAGAAVG